MVIPEILTEPIPDGYRLIDGQLINVMNKALVGLLSGDDGGVSGFTSVNPDSIILDGVTDASLALQNELDRIAALGGGTLKLLSGQGIYINALVEISSFCQLDLTECPVNYGANGTLGTAGEIAELPATQKPHLYANITAGDTSFGIIIEGANVTPTANDEFILRGQRDVTGKTLIKETGIIATATIVGNVTQGVHWTIVPTAPIQNSYQIRYANDAYEMAHPGQEDLSEFTVAVFSQFTTDITAGSYSAIVTHPERFNIGDYIYVNDTETVGEATGTSDTNTIHNEVNRIVAVDMMVGTITFQNALYHSYTTTYSGGISLLTVTNGASIYGARAKYVNANSNKNAYGFILKYSVNSYISDCELSYSTVNGINYGPIAMGFRIQYSLNCGIYRGVFRGLPDPAVYSSGQGYGFVLVGCTNCYIWGHTDYNARHGLLQQYGAAGNEVAFFHSVGCRISAVDFHGINAIKNHVHDFTVIGGDLFSPDSVDKAGIRLGNSSHTYGDFDNVIENGCIYNFLYGGSSNTGYAIDYVVESGGNLVKNIVVNTADIGIHGKYNASFPLSTLADDNVAQDINLINCTTALNFDGGSNQVIGGVRLENVVSDGSTTQFAPKNCFSYEMQNCKIRNPVASSGTYSVNVNNCLDVQIIGNDFNGANRGITLEQSPNAQILNNNLRNQIESVVFNDNTTTGNNNGYVFEGNVYTGTTSPTKTLGTSTGTIIDYGAGGGSGGGSSPYLSTYISGIYYPAIPVVSFSNKVISVNELYAVGPFLAVEGITISKLGVNVVTGISSTNVALGIYTDNAGFPSTLIGTVTGVVATATNTADAEVTGLSIPISSGSYYWLAANFNGAVTINAAGSTTAFRNQLVTSITNPAFVCKVATTYTGTLPSTFPTVTVSNFSTESAPHLWFRF